MTVHFSCRLLLFSVIVSSVFWSPQSIFLKAKWRILFINHLDEPSFSLRPSPTHFFCSNLLSSHWKPEVFTLSSWITFFLCSSLFLSIPLPNIYFFSWFTVTSRVLLSLSIPADESPTFGSPSGTHTYTGKGNLISNHAFAAYDVWAFLYI